MEEKKVVRPKRPAFTTMYWIHPVNRSMPGRPTIFGRDTIDTPEGFLSVQIPTSNVKSELKRIGRRLITEQDYITYMKEVSG